jgi:hypothetical protein
MPALKFLLTSRPYLRLELAFHGITYVLQKICLASEKESALISKEIDLVINHQCKVTARKLDWDDELRQYLERRLQYSSSD